MLLIFLVLLVTIVAVTLFTVIKTTFKHSTQQVLEHAQTSNSVIQDKINNQAQTLGSALQTIAKDFSTKSLIAGGLDDSASLISALQNHQRRVASDITWVLDGNNQFVASTTKQQFSDYQINGMEYSEGTLRFTQIGDHYYLVKSAPVKFVETSSNVNAWIFMGIDAEALFSEAFVELTNMQVNLVMPNNNSNTLLGSTLPDDLQNGLAKTPIQFNPGLNEFSILRQDFIYTTSQLGLLRGTPLFLVLLTDYEKAYISYNALLFQLIGLLLIAAIMALGTAMLLSAGITKPVAALAEIANKISGGTYVETIPKSDITEICYLSNAVDDMQESIKKREAEVHQLAYFDELTHLPNRLQFVEHFETLIQSHQNKSFAVLMMDLDRFREINDTMGHETGDKLLTEVAKRLRTFVMQDAFYARLGGDEFGIIFEQMSGIDPTFLAQGVAKLFEQPFVLEQLIVDVDTSIGVALYPEDGKSVQGLMQCADIALYTCKGKHDDFAIYQAEMNKYSMQRLNLMHELKGALAEGQLELYYQPKLSIHNNRIETVECLIRWTHPEHGFIPPDAFIPLAEQTGAIREVTYWVLQQALSQQQEWKREGIDLDLAVNISALDLVDMKLPAYVAELMTDCDCNPNSLTLEVTESAIMSDPQSALKALNTLRRMGIIISIDDFGTGYSSMAQLKKMPVQELKIDKAFVLDLASSKDDQVMVKTLISLAQNLSLQTVAEGVEDAESQAVLAEFGCTKIQGYHLSRPLNADSFKAWLTSSPYHTSASQEVSL
jgi:diguanylate cyclase (GGDEF)-like protein